MVISPPFLPRARVDESDEDYVRRAMSGDAPGEGAFPVSARRQWHGGLHLIAPFEMNEALDVRAVADGEIAYVEVASAHSDDPDHPLNYNGGWSSNGCVVLKHETEIGEGANARVTYFSISQHLEWMPDEIKRATVGKRVLRKDVLGQAGHIYGRPNRFHFQIVADDQNASRLLGRRSGDLSLSRDGRTDVCFGDVHFHLPAGFIYCDALANPHLSGQPPARVHDASQEPLYVAMRFHKGECVMTSYLANGTVVGIIKNDDLANANGRSGAPASSDNDSGAYLYEYRMQEIATRCFPQRPSSGYELLRLGRITSPGDALLPADAPHWRKVATLAGKVWVNLNGPGVTKYSDADFPHWRGWRIVDAQAGDSRCSDAATLTLAGVDAAAVNLEISGAGTGLSTSCRAERLARTVVKFTTEWDYTKTAQRIGWFKAPDPDGLGMSPDSFSKAQSHIEALGFWSKASLGMDSAPWHFEPREFIAHFKRCLWLSRFETIQLLPVHTLRKDSHGMHWEAVAGSANRRSAVDRLLNLHRVNLNRAMRKYGISTPLRVSAFFAQAIVESSWLTDLRESAGASATLHQGWYGRGFLQLTAVGDDPVNGGNNNYYRYFRWRGRNPIVPPGPRELGWRDEVADVGDDPAESAGYYWTRYQFSARNPHACEIASTYADKQEANVRTVVSTTNAGSKIYYFNEAARKAAAMVNIPGAVHGSYTVNGLPERFAVYANALVVLTDRPEFQDSHGRIKDFPETFERRIPWQNS